MDIKINKIIEPKCTLYHPDGTVIGEISSMLEFNDIRIQIMKNKVFGYYVIWEDKQINIDKYGNVDEWPKGFYDLIDEQLDNLCSFLW
jgi:predicted ATPase